MIWQVVVAAKFEDMLAFSGLSVVLSVLCSEVTKEEIWIGIKLIFCSVGFDLEGVLVNSKLASSLIELAEMQLA